MSELVARTRRLDADVDLLDVIVDAPLHFARNGIGLAGTGVALRAPLAEAGRAFASVTVDDEVGLPGCGPVGFLAVPFDPAGTAELVVPATVVGRADDGTRWRTTIAPAGSATAAASVRGPIDGGTEPSRFDVRPSRSPEEWCAAVAEATRRIDAGALEKVVLAREIVVRTDRPFAPEPVLRRLRAGYPDCFVFCIDGFVGASPELLVGRHSDIVRAHPMAGTTARRGDPQADARAAAALLASSTYRHEHQVTIDMVHDTLLPYCSYLDDEPEPSVVALANVAHLATRVEGRLSHPPASVLDLVAALHPTPAVCGRPRDAALALIGELEGFDRGRYAGAVGWVDHAGNGQFAVAIRCAQLDDEGARVFAGNGIVAGSDPTTELAETRAKLQAMLGALIRP